MASYTIVTSTAANVAGTNSINSTRVRVVANNGCVYAINAPATLTSNVGPLIPQNRPVDIDLGSIGNKLSVLPSAGGSTIITLTELGNVPQSGVNQLFTGVFTMTAANATLVGSTAGLNIVPGLYVSGGNITGNPTVSAVNSGNIIISANTTGSTITATVTFTTNPVITA